MLFDLKLIEHFPSHPGVYLMKNAAQTVIYVGKANNLKQRLKQYFAPTKDTRPMVPFLLKQIASIDTIVVPSEKEALLLENTLIKKHQPKFNACLKDDKTFVSLLLNHQHPWPMLRLVRYKGSPPAEGLYFGPYTSALAARETYELLTRLFPLRQCSDEELKKRTRPCLLHAIKRCVAPCVNQCTKAEYALLVTRTIQFLKGHDKEVLKELYTQMQHASDQLQFEEAALLLQKIRQIEHVVAAQPLLAQNEGQSTDVIALYREGEEVILMQLFFRDGKLIGADPHPFSHILETDEELITSFLVQHYTQAVERPEKILLPCSLPEESLIKEILAEASPHKMLLIAPQKGEKRTLVHIAEENAKVYFRQVSEQKKDKERLLLDLQEVLQLNRYPKSIECFDTSHLLGSDPVAALVTFIEGTKDKSRTRLFHIKHPSFGDDYSALREALTRHLTRAKETDTLPDLIIVDGGKGHLGIALEVFKTLDIACVDLIALAKEEGRHDKGICAEQIFLPGHHDPILLNPRSNLLFLLQQIRDEVHRTALVFHQRQRRKRTLQSALDTIPGIGVTKRTRLLRHFGSIENIRQASDIELRQVKGMTQKDIQALRAALFPPHVS